MVWGKDVAEEVFPREVILEQTLEAQACQGDKQRKSFWEEEDGPEVGTRCPGAEHQLPLPKRQQQIRLQEEGQPEDPRRGSEAHFPHSTSLLWL